MSVISNFEETWLDLAIAAEDATSALRGLAAAWETATANDYARRHMPAADRAAAWKATLAARRAQREDI